MLLSFSLSLFHYLAVRLLFCSCCPYFAASFVGNALLLIIVVVAVGSSTAVPDVVVVW